MSNRWRNPDEAPVGVSLIVYPFEDYIQVAEKTEEGYWLSQEDDYLCVDGWQHLPTGFEDYTVPSRRL